MAQSSCYNFCKANNIARRAYVIKKDDRYVVKCVIINYLKPCVQINGIDGIVMWHLPFFCDYYWEDATNNNPKI